MIEKKVYIYPQLEIKKQVIKGQNRYIVGTFAMDWEKKVNLSGFEINEIAKEILLQCDGLKTLQEIALYFSNKYNESVVETLEKINIFLSGFQKETSFEVIYQEEKIEHKILYTAYDEFYPTVASIELTSDCNIRCKHCYGCFGTCEKMHVPKNKLKDLFDNLVEVGLSTVELTGGDPSVYPYLSEAIDFAFESGMKSVVVLTNGIYISNKVKKSLYQHKDRVFLQIDVHSLNESYFDWFTGSKGNLIKVLNNIEELVENGISLRIVSMATPINSKEIPTIADWAYEHGAVSYAASLITELGRATDPKMDSSLFFKTKESLEEYFEEYKKISDKYPGFIRNIIPPKKNDHCGALLSQIAIKSNGDLKLCTMDTGDYFNLDLGNIFKDSLKNIYDSNRAFLNEFSSIQAPDFFGVCKGCQHGLFCNKCILRGLVRGSEIGGQCHWLNQNISPKMKKRLLNV